MAENRELALVLKLVADQFQSELKKSQGTLSEFNSFIKDWKTQLTAAGVALFAIAKSTANFGEEALKGSQKAGQTVETFTALSYAARLADIDQQQLIVGLKSLSQNMVEAARQTGDGEAVFRRLGVSALTASGQLRPTEQVLLDLADVFASSADGAGKTEAAVKLFGKAGIDLVPFLNQGKAGIASLMEEAQRLGVVLSKEDAEAANAFNDEIKKMDSAMRGLTLVLGKELLPVFTELLGGVTALTSSSGLGTFMKSTVFWFEDWAISIGLAGRQLALLGGNITDIFSEEKARALGLQMDAMAAEAERKRIAVAGRLSGEPSSSSVSGVATDTKKPEISQLADQEKLGKALLEMHLSMNRAIDIENKLRTEGVDIYRLQTDRQVQREKEDSDYQEHLGKMIVESTALEVRLKEAARVKEQQELVDNLQAWRAYYDQVGGSAEFRYSKELDLVRASLAQQTNLNADEAGRLLIAWQNHDQQLADEILNRTTLTEQQRETIMLQTLANVARANQQVSNDVFAGWALGMQKYVNDTKSGFGMAADMARRTAQEMEQGFKTFFFDMFEGRVKNLKDVLGGISNFVKQVASQIASQLATSWALKGLMGAKSFITGSDTGWLNNIAEFFGANFVHEANGGLIAPRRYAAGGQVLGTGNSDTIPAMLMPGEFVVSRRGVATLDQINAGRLPMNSPANVTVNVIGAPQDSAASVDVRRTTDSMVIDVLLRHQRDLRPLFGGA